MIKRYIFIASFLFVSCLSWAAAAPTPISSSTTIAAEGIYILTDVISSPGITISSDVTAAGAVDLNLNGYEVAGIVVEPGLNNITIRNGTATGASPAIDVQGGSNIIIEDVHAKDAGNAGIALANVIGGLVKNCTLTQNATGIELTSSQKITIDSCVANCNLFSGFSLISSTTNCLRDCKSLSTGQGNSNVLNQEIFGFVSDDGYANIFERCIANSTQALSTTDSQSLVAGFALRGSEACSKIIECESANAQTSVEGVTVPYGILLEAQFDGLVSVTSIDPGGTGGGDDQIKSVHWSPDGKFLAVGGEINRPQAVDDVFIYAFDRNTGTLIPVVSANPKLKGYDLVFVVRWSPDGMYLAVGGRNNYPDTADALVIFKFDRSNYSLTEVTSLNPEGFGGLADIVLSVDWSPDGRFLAVGGRINNPFGNTLIVYKFNQISGFLDKVVSLDPESGGGGTPDIIQTVQWSPNGIYLAVGGTVNYGGPGDDLIIYQFNSEAATKLTKVVSVNPQEPSDDDQVNAVEWSPNGKYLAVGGEITDSGDDVIIYRFDSAAATKLTPVVSVNPKGGSPDDIVISLSWSPDGKYLAVGGEISGADDVIIYQFDPSNPSLSEVDSINPGDGGSGDEIFEIDWSPDGQYLAVGGRINYPGDGDDVIIYQALTFPCKNVVKNNTVYCNGSTCGIGISGSSIGNFIAENVSYANPISPAGGVALNYAFVTNVFNQLFGQAPTDLQNISIGCNEPICMPPDLALLLKQLRAKACGIVSVLDELIAGNPECTPQGFITGPTTISSPGLYCVVNDISDAGTVIQIASDDVTLDLNNHTLSGSNVITFNGTLNNVTIQDGTLNAASFTDGITDVASGVKTNITIDNVSVVNALFRFGIEFNNVHGGLVKNCTFKNNQVAFCAQLSTNIVVDNCVALENITQGFALILSTTCCIKNCKALSTGATINDSATRYAAFSSISGYGNIFENCIANGTQNLEATNFDVVVAGFLLQGTEQCTKIINCEAANAQVDPDGVTVPHGILLQGSIDDSFTLTGVPPIPNPSDAVNAVDWSLDGKYVAVGGDDNTLRVYAFDRATSILSQIASVSLSANILSLEWSASGGYLAVGFALGDSAKLRVYEFCSTNNSLMQVAIPDVALTGNVNAVDWSPDEKSLAIIESDATLRVYSFDRVNNVLALQGSSTPGDGVYDVDWYPAGALLGVASDGFIKLYRFESNTLSFVADSASTAAPMFNAVAWSPDGKYVAAAASDDFLGVFRFDGGSVITDVAAEVLSNPPTTVAWSADSQYIAVGTTDNAPYVSAVLAIYAFNHVDTLSLQNSIEVGDTIQNISWSPDGALIAVGLENGSNQPLELYQVQTFPSKNVIKGNTVYCNSSGGDCPRGVGVSGSSITNMIIGNTSYSNPIGPVGGVGQNYIFVTNVFKQQFGQAPSDMQNISIGCNEPICMPDDLALLEKQIKYKLCNISSRVDLLQTMVSMAACVPQGFITGPTTISSSGVYCVAQDISNAGTIITISADDVTIDLNNHTLSGSNVITFNGTLHNITIQDGTLNAASFTDGITDAASGMKTNITIDNVSVVNALFGFGIEFNNVHGGVVKNCTFKNNQVAFFAQLSTNIVVDNCVALENITQGFELILSTTCCIKNCKALSTGATINDSATRYAAFSSISGYGNIFENCIANGTQNLEATDFDVVVAGFLLQGTEQCTKIINCEASNAQVSPNGQTIPHGILLEPSSSISLDAVDNDLSNLVHAVDWSPDGKLIAVGINSASSGPDLFVYSFDYQTQLLTQLDSIDPGSGVAADKVSAVVWHPDGIHLAVGGDFSGTAAGNNLALYRFEKVTQKLIELQNVSVPWQEVTSVDWSPDGRYLAVVGTPGTSTNITIYTYDAINEQLIEFVSKDLGTTVIGAVDWAPGNDLLAFATSTPGAPTLYVYRRTSDDIVLVDSELLSGTVSLIGSVKWSFDGKFIAVGTLDLSSNQVVVYAFDKSNNLIFNVSISPFATSVPTQLDWSPDGRFLGVTGGNASSLPVRVYSFDRAGTLSSVATAFVNADIGGAISWSPDGQYISAGLIAGTTGLFIREAEQFPQKNVIKDNVVYCNGNGCPNGVGISGSSIANMIIGNTAYANPSFAQGSGGQALTVSTNYVAVQNVFNQLFGQAPSLLQNVSLAGCEPICMPEDLNLILKQIKAKVGTCAATPITQADIPTTINSAGVYCLVEDVSNATPITIDADDVALNLNNHVVTGTAEGISILSGHSNVSISNGRVVAGASSSAITALNGTHINVENVNVQSSLIGIHFDGVMGGSISNCTLTQNTTGLELDGCANITIDHCVASKNINAGYCLLSSVTNCLRDCKALSTGVGAQSVNDAIGFSSNNGYGNIFENCIANGTQNSSATGGTPIVAGFALRGTEGCSKIINCEAGNATIADTGDFAAGIWIEGTVSNLITLTAINPGVRNSFGEETHDISGIQWTPDHKYLVLGGGFTNFVGRKDFFVYEYDTENFLLSEVASITSPEDFTSGINIDISPDGVFIATGHAFTGSPNTIQIYEFCPQNNTLTHVLSSAQTDPRFVAWSPDGAKLAVANGTGPNEVLVIDFDRISRSFGTVHTASWPVASEVNAVAWSPDGNFLAAVGADFFSSPVGEVRIYSVAGTGALTEVDDLDLGDELFAVEWSPNGKYLALTGIETGDDLWLYEFVRTTATTGTLSFIDSAEIAGPTEETTGLTLSWSPDGRYLAVGAEAKDSTDDVFVYRVRPTLGSSALSFVGSVGLGASVNQVDWGPDGQFIAACGTSGGFAANNDVWVVRGFDFASKNVITNNKVYCNGDDNCPNGFGIYGSSIANMIIGNTSYANPTVPFAVAQNYAFVTNQFNQLFGQAPTDVQNIGLAGCVPICMPEDLCLLAKQNRSLIDVLNVILDAALTP